MAEASTTDFYFDRKFEELNFSEHISRDMKRWLQASKSVKLFLTGKTGVGKSTLLNALIGKRVTEEGDELDPHTKNVSAYETEINDVKVTIWDSPGLQDGTTREKEYLADMKKNCRDMHLCVYCTSALDNRFVRGCGDIKAMQKLTGVFGQDMWRHTIIILTFANTLEEDGEVLEAEAGQKPNVFKQKIQKFERALKEALVRDVHVERNIAEKVSVLPAGHESQPHLLDRDFWLSSIWFESLYTMKPIAQPAMIKINVNRIVNHANEVQEEDRAKFLHEQPLIFSRRGAQIGKKYGSIGKGKEIGMDIGEEASVEVEILLTLHNIISHFTTFFSKLL